MTAVTAGLRFAAVPLAIVILVGAAAVVWRNTPWLQTLEGQILDGLFQLRGTEVPHSDTLILAIDDRTVAHFGGWPIGRDVLAELILRLDGAGASAVGLDLLLLEPRLDANGDPTPGDRALLDASTASGHLVLPFASTDRASAAATASDETIRSSAYLTYVQSDTPTALGLSISGDSLLVPFAELAGVVSVGNVSVPLEPDGAVRHWLPVIGYDDRRYPSMALELARLHRGVDRAAVLWVEGERLLLGNHSTATDQTGRLTLSAYGPAGTFRTISLVDFMTGRVPAHMVRNRIVLVGATATGVGDSYVTAFDGRLSGVELIATMTQNLVHGESLTRNAVTYGLSLALMLIGTILTASLSIIRQPLLLFIGAIAVLVSGIATIYGAFHEFRLWLDTVPTATAIALTGAWVISRRVARDRRSTRMTEERNRALSRFVAPALADRLATRDIALTGEHECTAAVMFIDLVGFTKATEDLPAVATLPLLGRFYRLVESATDAHNGIVDKFIGDGAMALFGISGSRSDTAAADAVRCALRLVTDFNAGEPEAWEAGGRKLAISIGVHYGSVAMAEIGGHHQVQFTATGDTVNVASRLEELTRDLATPLVVSNAVIDAARDQLPEETLRQFVILPQTTLRGRSKALSAWALSEIHPDQAVA